MHPKPPELPGNAVDHCPACFGGQVVRGMKKRGVTAEDLAVALATGTGAPLEVARLKIQAIIQAATSRHRTDLTPHTGKADPDRTRVYLGTEVNPN